MGRNLAGVSWFKSSHSQGTSECVEVAWLDDGAVGLRDSKDPAGPALIFSPAGWSAFTALVIAGGPGRSDA
ncbi:DUF397 domain-containing protein [Nocardia crassostreae]|uniref:DUF397 domain-containing protein n=1 Tax=Nocardia crassostreae TaxID=53428 RepID=UPI000A029D97|nr:DUF397 domain-containing protein [Nocardia crassostreae]